MFLLTLCLASVSFGEPCSNLTDTRSNLIERSWAAYSALADGRADCRSDLVAALRAAIPYRDAPEDSEEYAYTQSLFDALIQLHASVPADVLLPFWKQRRAEVLLLLARNPGNEKALLAMMDDPINTAEWLAVCNLLFEQRSMAFFRKTLAQLKITHTFVVKDWKGQYGLCGGAIGSAIIERRFPRHYPPIALYQLDFAEGNHSAPDDESLAFKGPQNVFVRRTVVATDSEESWIDLNFFHELEPYRTEYLALAFTDLSVERAGKILFGWSDIEWQGPDDFNARVEAGLASQAADIQQLLASIQARGLDAHGLSLAIKPVIDDFRHKDRSPLPPVNPLHLTDLP